MGTFLYLAGSTIEIQLLLLPITIPMLAGATFSILTGLSREDPGLAGNRTRLLAVAIAQGVPSFLILLYGSMEFHIVPSLGVPDDVANGWIGVPFWIQLPLAAACAWWCRRAWPISLGIGIAWGAYSLGTAFMAGMAATGKWL